MTVGGDVDPYHSEWLEYTEEERLHIVQVLHRDLQLKWTDYNRIWLVISILFNSEIEF